MWLIVSVMPKATAISSSASAQARFVDGGGTVGGVRRASMATTMRTTMNSAVVPMTDQRSDRTRPTGTSAQYQPSARCQRPRTAWPRPGKTSDSTTATQARGGRSGVNKLVYRQHAPERGDVLVFDYPKEPDKRFVKRVIGVPGDTIAIDRGRIVLNGRPVMSQRVDGHCGYDDRIDGEWTRRKCIAYRESLNGHDYGVVYDPEREGMSFDAVTVPPDSYYVLGDNRDNSHDSRFWGFVPRALVVGRAETIAYSDAHNGFWARAQQRIR